MSRSFRIFETLALTAALTVGTVNVASADVVVNTDKGEKAEKTEHAAPHAAEHAPTVTATEAHEAPAAHGAQAGHGTEHGAAAHGGEHGAEHGGGEHELQPINWVDTSNKKQPPYLAMAVNFALLLFLYYRFGKQPVADALKKRREDVAKQIEEASRIKAEAADRAKKYQAQLEHLDTEAEATKKAIRTTGEAERDRVLREAGEKAARMERDADAMLDAEHKQAKRALYEEAVEKAVVKAEEMLKSKLTQADHERLAEEFLAQLAKQGGASKGSSGGAALVDAPMNKRGEP